MSRARTAARLTDADRLQRMEAEVEALQALGLEGLRAVWRTRAGLPPKLRSTDLLRALLAWEIQAKVLGGLDPATARAVRRQGPARAIAPAVRPGTRIVREWKGQAIEVEATAEGFLWKGRAYDNLSQIAREVTGVRWNGPRFFGLRQSGGAQP